MKSMAGEIGQQSSSPQTALETITSAKDCYAVTVLDDARAPSSGVTHAGIGTTYSTVLRSAPLRAIMAREVPFEVDVDGIQECEVSLRTALYDDGMLLGGIDEAGRLHTSLSLWEEHGEMQNPLDYFAAGLARQRRLQMAGMEPIFAVTEGAGDKSCTTPKYTISAKGRRFAISDMYTNESQRPSLLLYAEGVEQPVHYYQSRSHGVWRALLAQGKRCGTHSGWLAKGMFGYESTADAPLALQKLFATLQAVKQPDQRMRQEMTKFVQQVPEDKILSTDQRKFSAQVPAAALMRAAGISPVAAYRTAPDLVDEKGPTCPPGQRLFRRGARPDFSSVLDSWKVATAFYGEVTVRVVPSKDGVLQYGIYEADVDDGRKQRWVGTAEIAAAPLTSLGLAREWPALSKDITEPPIEYAYTQDGKNTGYDKRRSVTSDFEKYALRSLAARCRSPRAFT